MTNSGTVDHYKKYFRMVHADSDKHRHEAYDLRFQVFCQEFGYHFKGADYLNKIERDEYDDQAQHCLLIHKPSNRAIGYIRLIIAEKRGVAEHLPIEFYCNSIDKEKFDFDKLGGKKLGEFSRLAVIPIFRRRKSDEPKPYSFASDADFGTEEERRCHLPVISLSLSLAGFAMTLQNGIDYGVALMEPRLVFLLKRYGILFNEIGRIMDYFGPRAPYLLQIQETLGRLNADARSLLAVIHEELGAFDGSESSPAVRAGFSIQT